MPDGHAEVAEPRESSAGSALLAPARRTKPVRSSSGVAIVAVMSSPAACPHGKCTFCPGGPDVGSPQSYTGFEPSTMRARRNGYDPRRIVQGRLGQLQRNGHAVEKVDVVVQGGTFPAREPAYQDWFIAGIYAGLNAGPDEDGPAWEDEGSWMAMPEQARQARLAQLMRDNESARCRGIGLTIETKPDWCFEGHLDRMLGYGATRVEIGLQALDNGVLKATHRGHTLEDSRRSMQLARDAGFKVCVHMMPGLPRQRKAGLADPQPNREPWETGDSGPSTAKDSRASPKSLLAPSSAAGELDPDPAADLEDFRRLFAEPDWRPDMLKVYPTLVVMEGETLLKRQWKEGKYHPYDTAAATALVGEAKGFVPEWCRIQRIDRDIPTTHVEAGVMNSNLRQLAQKWRADRSLPACRCIRCREVAHRAAEGRTVSADPLRLVRRDYEAGGGSEAFLALEDPHADAVVAFVRVRRLGPEAHRPETRVPGGAAFVRELKVYGVAQALGHHDDDPEGGSWQHRGLGARLLGEAEGIAFSEWQVGRLLVIAGPGVKPYYRRHGYADLGPYVGKVRDANP
ncbi:MAG TPA: radical SAM protein [Candidatus Thermoplasmatota archaeon]|nr:radical SAM protein [Candidatus Thermoplasmatota archaeon]